MINKLKSGVESDEKLVIKLKEEITSLTSNSQKLDKQISTQTNKLKRSKDLYKSVEYAIDNFLNSNVGYENCKLPVTDFEEYELISPSITLKLHCMDMKDLRSAYRENEKQITNLLDQYSSRYR